MKEWYTPSEIASLALPGLPSNRTAVIRYVNSNEWQGRQNLSGEPMARKRQGGKGGGWEYHYTLFPTVAQTKLVADAKPATVDPRKANKKALERDEMWAWFESMPAKRRAKAEERLAVLQSVEALKRGGMAVNPAVQVVAMQKGVGPRSIYGWMKLVEGVRVDDWLPYLAPRHAGRTSTSACSPEAWEAFKTLYLRPEQPELEDCYRLLEDLAEQRDWVIPSSRTFARRIEKEIPKPVRVLLREGLDALKTLFPPQERDRTCFHALEAVNTDGHEWDVFVRYPDGVVDRPTMVAIQDLYSNKILAFRDDRSENTDLIRLTFGDMFEEYGIPDHCYLDNGRAFASKYLTGGTPTRYRFKVRPEDPVGVLTALGIELHWTTPYSGQSKPIERAFRDLCRTIAKHPAFAGAYVGNKPDAKPENYMERAVDLETFRKVVAQGIAKWNARPKRRTKVCGGVMSFDEAFNKSYAKAVIRRASDEQLRMCMLAAEAVSADKVNGSVRILGNRYWDECLIDQMGKKLVVRFDPDHLYDGVALYRLDGSYIGNADCLEAAGFNSVADARKHNRTRKAWLRAKRDMAALEKDMEIDVLAEWLDKIEVDEVSPPEASATRLLVQGSTALASARLADADADLDAQHIPSDDIFKNFAKGVELTLVKG